MSEDKSARSRNIARTSAMWRHIFDAIEDPAFLHDAEFRLLLANAAYCREAGLTEAEAQGKLYWEVFPRGAGPLPRRKDALRGNDLPFSQNEVQVGARLFLVKGYIVHDGPGRRATHCSYSATSRHSAWPRWPWRKARSAFAEPWKRRATPLSVSMGKAAPSLPGIRQPR